MSNAIGLLVGIHGPIVGRDAPALLAVRAADLDRRRLGLGLVVLQEESAAMAARAFDEVVAGHAAALAFSRYVRRCMMRVIASPDSLALSMSPGPGQMFVSMHSAMMRSMARFCWRPRLSMSSASV